MNHSYTYYTNDENAPYLGSATDRDDNPELKAEAHVYATNLIRTHSNKIQVYTDGSVRGPKNNRQAGYGIVIVNDIDGQYDRIYTKKQSIEQPNIAVAEATAIQDALDWLLLHPPDNGQDIIFFCDNKYVVNMCQSSPKSHRKHRSIAISLQQKLFELGQNVGVQVVWLPAHCDIVLHDEADLLACQSAGFAF